MTTRFKRALVAFLSLILLGGGLFGGVAPAQAKVKGTSPHGVPQKAGGVSTMSLTAGYHYAYAQETPATAQPSMKANALISNPGGISSTGHSLTEVTVQWGSASGPYRDGIVELGWEKANGYTGPKLFASCWKNNVWGGTYTGGCGFWDFNGATGPNLGDYITADVGTSKQFVIQYDATNACNGSPGWWIAYGAPWVGCFPTNGVGGNLSASFTGAQFRQGFFEVYKAGTTCYQMGNGTYATTTAGAYLASMGTVGTAGNFSSYGSTDPTVYSMVALSGANSSFRGGGTEPAPC